MLLLSMFAGASAVSTKKRDRQAPVVGTVARSFEFERIAALPRRVLSLDHVTDITPLVAKPGGTMKLMPVQSAALIEAAWLNGAFNSIGCGFGKTLISLLLPVALDSQKTVLLVPTELKKKTLREIDKEYAPNFNLPLDRVEIVTYHQLQSQKHDDILERIMPDLVVADEAHELANPSSARCRRIFRFYEIAPHCRFAFLTGTATSKSIRDYTHLMELALRGKSPVPRAYPDIRAWSGAIDVKPIEAFRPGVLMEFCKEGESVREGYMRRLTETPGVIATSQEFTGSSLVIEEIAAPLPDNVKDALETLKSTWTVGGEEISEAARFAFHARTLSCGFYYVWVWPGGEPDTDWLAARSAWSKAVRHKLRYARAKMDTEGFLAQAAERWYQRRVLGKQVADDGPEWACDAWIVWREQRSKPEPPTRPVWISDYLCRDALERAHAAKEPTILFYEHQAMGQKMAELSGLPDYGEGTDASETEFDVLIASRDVQGQGKNLQHHYSRCIYTMLPTNNRDFEQSVSRIHRTGQLADTVTAQWYGHTQWLKGSMVAVLKDAHYQLESTKARQRVLYGTRLDSITVIE